MSYANINTKCFFGTSNIYILLLLLLFLFCVLEFLCASLVFLFFLVSLVLFSLSILL